jgi:hypothetical protein
MIKAFQDKLENCSGKKLQVRINDNRSTMLSVRWGPDCTKVSLHRIFLRAPQNVMQALACYIRGDHKSIDSTVRAFIEDNLKKIDYSHKLNPGKLHIQGSVYNLHELYREVNSEYFDDKLNLHITWFGKPRPRNRSCLTFGLYYDPFRLIKINRFLDSPAVPEYLISYIVYHEMLHNVCPSYVDENGLHRVHSKEFKERETKFRYYQLAQKWIRDHQSRLFAKML